MAVIVNASPASPTANSFVSVARADEIMSGQLYADQDWENADTDEKSRALITATRLICDAVPMWMGYPTTLIQSLPFPRSGIYGQDGLYYRPDVNPVVLEEATAEFARQLIALKRMPDSPAKYEGIKSLKAGPVDIVFDETRSQRTVELPPSVMQKLRWLTGSISRLSAPVVRT
jgi:hypothetical protein